MYIPFVQITISLFEELIEKGYKYFVLQRFEWVAVEHSKGFLLSAYANPEEAQTHSNELDAKEGKLLQMPHDYEKIIKLLEVNSGYRIFLDRFKDADWEKRMLRLFKNNIVNYLRFNTRFKRKDPVEILFTLEHGRVLESVEQETLFDKRDKRHDPLMHVLDNLNKKYGTNTVRLGIQDKQKWKMRQDLLSPKYTTDMKDIITIRV